MTYNPENQYRCTIIRGKAKNAMDDLLPAYASILDSICPCPENQFPLSFNRELARILPGFTPKTLNNHRTEIAGKLFGMYYTNDDNVVQTSQRTKKLLSDNDQPSFFKDLCYKFQFPNGMDKINKIRQDISNKISIRQCAYIMEALLQADKLKTILSIDEVGYYILNSLEALQRKVSPGEVVATIIERRHKKIYKKPPSGSRGMQHIRETFNYLELANLIRIDKRNLIMNSKEKLAIDYIAASWNKPLDFDLATYKLDTLAGRKEMYLRWQQYYSGLAAPDSSVLDTPITSLSTKLEEPAEEGYDVVEGIDTAAIGNEGEVYVHAYEKNRIKAYNARLIQKVLLLSKTKGLGYDIQSIRADKTKRDEHAIFIEVKATKRVTAPGAGDTGWIDLINLTRNEWVAAEQHKDAYFVYRVYFTPERVVMFIINDPAYKSEIGLIRVVPEKYRVEFDSKSGIFK